jgi:peptidoglycan hydrolase-like protein with peptidoglycan-binding domain
LKEIRMKKRVALLLVLVLTLTVTLTYGQAHDYFAKNDYQAGENHKDLRLVKMILKSQGIYDGEIDDKYDYQITEAIMKYQRYNGLKVTGNIDDTLIEKMYSSDDYPFLNQALYKVGMESDDIVFIQKALDELGFFSNSEYTKYFGYKTEKAVRDFQVANGMSPDGVIGRDTIKILYDKGLVDVDLERVERLVGNLNFSEYRNGDKLPDVKVLQKALANEVEFDSDQYTHIFGDVTEASVKKFQEKYGLEADGVCGKGTIEKLVALGYVSNNTIVSRGKKVNGRYGEYLHWNTVQKMVKNKSTVFVVEDLYTGKTFRVMAAYGHNHIDAEPMSKNDSLTIKKLWGGQYSWARRPVLVYLNNRVIAASMNGMPHAGREELPDGATVSSRSGKYGRGYNYDYIKGNGVSGHVCIHFRGSTLHKNNKSDPEHQRDVKVAAGLL